MLKSILRSPVTTIVLFVLAAGLVVTGTVGAVQAAPRVASNDYLAQVQLSSIETALTENGAVVEGDGALLKNMVPAGEEFRVGKSYDEQLAVMNTGDIDEYVRVTVTKYWTDANGKAVDLDPSLIRLHFVEGDGWSIDQAASTPERTVLYYATPIAPGQSTSLFADKVAIDGKVVSSVTKLADGTNEFDYDGVQFHVKATVDAVQTHNAEQAMVSAWGRTV